MRKKRNQGALTRQGGGGTSSPFPVPSTSPMISAEYRRAGPHKLSDAVYGQNQGARGDIRDLGEGLLRLSSVISKHSVFADYLRRLLTGN